MQHSRLYVKQWQHFEPFTHRTAPWGPVYQEVLTKLGLQHLESADAQALVMLLLIGSAQQGFLPSRPVLAEAMGLSVDRLNSQLGRLGPYLYEIHKRAPPRLFAGLPLSAAHPGRSYA